MKERKKKRKKEKNKKLSTYFKRILLEIFQEIKTHTTGAWC